jgi:hypothetical protein
MTVIYQVDRDGVIGMIEAPDDSDPGRPLTEQWQVKIGVDPAGPELDADEFEAPARLVILELRNYLRDEWGMDGATF